MFGVRLLMAAIARARELDRLRSLDDRMLDDIGISRRVDQEIATTHKATIEEALTSGKGVLVIIRLQEWARPNELGMRARAYLGVYIETGPHKHAIQQTFFLYVYEPAGNRVEVANAGARLILAPDWETVTWTEAERKKGQAWGLKTIESFHTHGTPPVEKV